MKKMFTLLLSIGIVSASFAQRNGDRNSYNGDQYAMTSNSNYGHHDDRYSNGRNYSYEQQRSFEIQQIMQNYSRQVMMIDNNRFMRNHQKRVAIRDAKFQRDQQIAQVNAKYNRFRQDWGRR